MSQSAGAVRRGPAGPRDVRVIDALTGVRIIAALWVVAEHFREPLFSLASLPNVLWPVLRSGYLGVEVFFVLSGFIIAHNYAATFANGFGASYLSYLQARLARIYPVYLFTLICLVAIVVGARLIGLTINSVDSLTPLNFLLNVMLLQAAPGVPSLNWPAWSISAEMAAYLVFPVIALLLAKIDGRRAAWLASSVLVTGIVLVQLIGVDGNAVAPQMVWLRIATGFATGCLLWKFWAMGPQLSSRWSDGGTVASVVAVIVIISIARGDESRASFFALAPIAALIYFCAAPPGVIGRFLGSRPMVWGGRVSYSLYLTHGIAFLVLGKLLFWESFERDDIMIRAGILTLYAAFICVATVATYYLIEEPGRRLLRRVRVNRS